jgi:hypothetical protein
MNQPEQASLETDPRFPSGPWTGFFVQTHLAPGRYSMELLLTFRQGTMTGEGRDVVGRFLVRGRYEVQDGRCHWTKRYLGGHDVFYQGFNEGKGIWGTWVLPDTSSVKGGFHIWPEGMPDPTKSQLTEEADLPAPVTEIIETEEPVLEPVGLDGLLQDSTLRKY